ncbi:MAG TPA: LAGLIDADG family homing endonuclease [Alphaproteobacteria bacterium]|jgi:hypothetical protein|nr:LAGLIDADG family homing endonuclease [Alphaproteobacteria bacterium]
MGIPREPLKLRGLRRDYTRASQISKHYLLGLLHDATERKTTYRIAAKSKDFSDTLVKGIKNLGMSAWNYKEGKNRNLWIAEFSKILLKNVKIVSKQNKIDYIRGYFDAEGGISRQASVRFYIYFCQKDKDDLLEVKRYLEELGIGCGKMHNPSYKVDPNYWRFFVGAKSYSKFAKVISSNHPEKITFLRMKI